MSALNVASKTREFDVIVLGGGLHGCLAAWLLASPRLALVEKNARLAGNHTWSCHAEDLGSARELFAELLPYRWPAYEAAFPGFSRTVEKEYWTTTFDVVAEKVTARLQATAATVFVDHECEIVDAHTVEVVDSEKRSRRLTAEAILDARGAERSAAPCGWQKFLGWEVETAEPHGRALPTVMDARVPQTDGFRFVYVLPMTSTRLLIEDTYYADSPIIDADAARSAIREYADRSRWRIARVLREERGALPIPFAPPESAMSERNGPLRLGYRGGWFHPTTGYSLGLGASALGELYRQPIDRWLAIWSKLGDDRRRRQRFPCFLDRLWFRGYAPADRWRVLERFYRVLPDDAVARFYGLRSTLMDRIRLLSGKPPRGFSPSRYLWGAGR